VRTPVDDTIPQTSHRIWVLLSSRYERRGWEEHRATYPSVDVGMVTDLHQRPHLSRVRKALYRVHRVRIPRDTSVIQDGVPWYDRKCDTFTA